MIELKGVSKSYGGSVVLHEIDLTIAAGRTTALIGPSGCGKSTLLRLMIGLVQPDAGSVSIAGTELTPATVLEMRHGLGYVIQDGGLFPHLNARDNVILMARYLGWESGRINDRIGQLAELTRFPLDGLDRFPAQLSGGQRQRVSLMRCSCSTPRSSCSTNLWAHSTRWSAPSSRPTSARSFVRSTKPSSSSLMTSPRPAGLGTRSS